MKTYICVVQVQEPTRANRHLRELTEHFFALFNVYPPCWLDLYEIFGKVNNRHLLGNKWHIFYGQLCVMLYGAMP